MALTGSAPTDAGLTGHPLLLSIDFEDWHQLVRRRLGDSGWERPGPALARQAATLLDLLDELGVKATFFVLGMSARAHPHLVSDVVARGHEIACHGDLHRPVHSQSRSDFAHDLRSARRTIEEVTGHVPVGYRAPAFSITRECPWAHMVLVEEGFLYDSSQHDSPRIRNRVAPPTAEPHPIELPGGRLWEFPLAVWRPGRLRLPVGGASYWAMLPTAAVLHGLGRAGRLAALYLHPQELDPEPLHVGLTPGAAPLQRAHGTFRSLQRNLARWRTPDVLRAIAGRYQLIPYREAYERLADGSRAGS
jgi:polysaccharide deacetylase family protein (PEP-CTERM system associated)